MTPESALEMIPGFSSSTVAAILSDGPTNRSLLIHRAGEAFVLRMDKTEAVTLGLDRVAEQAICKVVSAAGLTPEPVYADHENRLYLRRYVEAVVWDERAPHQSANLERLGALLAEVHALPLVGNKLEPARAIAAYAKHIGTPGAARLQIEAETLLCEIQKTPQRICLCHNDLVFGNILEAGRLILIDWEYAGQDDPWFDLAVVVQHHQLDRKLSSCFLSAYLQRQVTESELVRFELYCRYYQILLKLWHLRVTGL